MEEGSNQEQQDEEVESLEYIYEEGQFKVIGRSPYRLQIDVSEETEDGTTMACRFLIEMPPDYPSVGPTFEVSRIDGVSKDQCVAIAEHVKGQIDDFLEMPMIFSLTSAAKEWLQENAAAISEEEQERKNKSQGFETITDHADEEVEVVLKNKGTPVTPESFAQWKEEFDKEMAAEKTSQQKGKKKMTGRQMFEQGKADVASDGVAKDGEEQFDIAAARKEAKALEEKELEGIDVGVWDAEIDLEDEDFGDLDEDDDE